MPRRDHSDVSCSCSSCGSSGSCSCSCSCSCTFSRSSEGKSVCSCSAESSCYYTSTTQESTLPNGKYDRAFAFSKDVALEPPQLLQLRPLSSVNDTRAMRRDESGGELFVLGLPPLPRDLDEPNKAEVLLKSPLHRESNTSVAVQTAKSETVSRSTSPVAPATRETAVLTDMDGTYLTSLETHMSNLCTENEYIRLRYGTMEEALSATHEQQQQQLEQLQAQCEAMAHSDAQRKADLCYHMKEMFSTEAIFRQTLMDWEDNVWTELCTRAQSEARERQTSCSAMATESTLNALIQCATQLLSHATQSLCDVESQRRADVILDEEDCRGALHKVKSMESTCQCEVRHCKESAKAAVAERNEMEKRLREALEREKELRLQYLHVLRLPTTNIEVTASRDKARSEESSGDTNISVHARFARAHQEAVRAVMLQRRRVPLSL